MLQAERQRSKDMGQELQVLYNNVFFYLRRPSGEFRKKIGNVSFFARRFSRHKGYT